MASRGATTLRQRLSRVILSHAGDGASAKSVNEAVRAAHADLTAVFAPLISAAGVEALWGRAFDLVQREYPAADRRVESATTDEISTQVSRWLERQAPSVAPAAAVEMFATFAELLNALIGEPLTTRYLEKAWPDGFADVLPTRKKT